MVNQVTENVKELLLKGKCFMLILVLTKIYNCSETISVLTEK